MHRTLAWRPVTRALPAHTVITMNLEISQVLSSLCHALLGTTVLRPQSLQHKIRVQ